MRHQDELQYWESNGNYMDGNAARDVKAQRRKEQVHQEFVEQQEEEQERRRRRRQARAAAQRSRERALQISPGYVAFLTVTMAVLGAVFGCYLHLQSELNKNVQNVAMLEADLLDLKNQNDKERKKIANSVNLETIRQRAIDELGMVYPQKEQVEYFEADNDDYMSQYKDIPER